MIRMKEYVCTNNKKVLGTKTEMLDRIVGCISIEDAMALELEFWSRKK